MKQHTSSAETIELRIAKVLRFGVLLSGICIGIGLVGNFISTDSTSSWRQLTAYQALPLSDQITQLLATNQWSQLVCYAGLFVLISLPIIRVFLTAFLFVRNKEFVLAALAFFVLFILILSFVLGIEMS